MFSIDVAGEQLLRYAHVGFVVVDPSERILMAARDPWLIGNADRVYVCLRGPFGQKLRASKFKLMGIGEQAQSPHYSAALCVPVPTLRHAGPRYLCFPRPPIEDIEGRTVDFLSSYPSLRNE